MQQGSFNPSVLLANDSGSNVVEVIQSSRQKAKTMVDVAVQVWKILIFTEFNINIHLTSFFEVTMYYR